MTILTNTMVSAGIGVLLGSLVSVILVRSQLSKERRDTCERQRKTMEIDFQIAAFQEMVLPLSKMEMALNKISSSEQSLVQGKQVSNLRIFVQEMSDAHQLITQQMEELMIVYHAKSPVFDAQWGKAFIRSITELNASYVTWANARALHMEFLRGNLAGEYQSLSFDSEGIKVLKNAYQMLHQEPDESVVFLTNLRQNIESGATLYKQMKEGLTNGTGDH